MIHAFTEPNGYERSKKALSLSSSSTFFLLSLKEKEELPLSLLVLLLVSKPPLKSKIFRNRKSTYIYIQEVQENFRVQTVRYFLISRVCPSSVVSLYPFFLFFFHKLLFSLLAVSNSPPKILSLPLVTANRVSHASSSLFSRIHIFSSDTHHLPGVYTPGIPVEPEKGIDTRTDV